MNNGYLLIAAAWLITLAFLVNNYWLYYSSPKGVQHSLQQNIREREKEFYALASDTGTMDRLLNRRYDATTLHEMTGTGKDFYLFFYRGNWETFWTTNQIAYGPEVVPDSAGVYFDKLQSGYYEIIRKDLGTDSLGKDFVLGFIPVKEQYYFTNPYLPDRYYQLSRISKQYVIDMEGGGLPVYSVSGSRLFSIQFRKNPEGNTPSWLSGIFLALAVICVLVFINLFAVFLGEKTNKWWGFAFLCVFVFLIRWISYLFPFPFAYEHYRLFDATIYASNELLRSLGDLLINVALAAWLISYARPLFRGGVRLPEMRASRRIAAMFILDMIAYYACLLGYGIIRGLVVNSKISFDVRDFFSLSAYSIVGFVILGLLAYCFFVFSMIVNGLLDQLSGEADRLKYTVLAVTGIVWLILQLFQTTSGYIVIILVWTFFYFYLLDLSRQHLGKKLDLPRFILWLFIMTASVTALLLHYNTWREKDSRIQLAIKLSKQKDPTLEFNLGMIDTALVKDSRVIEYFRNGRRRSAQALSRYLLNNYFSNLYNRYEFGFYAYDNKGGILGSPDKGNAKASLDFILQHQAEPASVSDLYYHEVSFTEFSYIARLQIRDPLTDSSLGYFYYRMKPKAIKPETLYPKLLMKSEDNRFESTLNKYSYAVYDHLRLVYNRNDYPFPLHISMKDVPMMDYQFTTEDGYSLLWYKPSEDKMVVVVKPNRILLEAMTLFAYMFCIFLLLIFILRVFRFLIRARMRPKALKEILNMTITMRVQATIIFMVVFVFIVLGISTISFFIRRYDATHRDELVSGMNILLSGVEQAMHDNVSADDPGNPFDASKHADLKNAIRKIADTHGVDINIYDLDGNLQVSTQNLIYENGLLASKIDPQAYYKLFYLHQVQVIQNEQVGSLKFLSSYATIRDDSGHTIAFLNQPYFASQVDLKEEISNFLVTLINLNAFIFLLSGLIALLFTNAITRSFGLIGEKLRKVNLSGINEEIVWEPNDEIGGLVREYNKMVHKLQVSAAALAKSEREGAWREMARQVAHEIKNPLTPMKLSLQHLQRAITEDSPEARRMTREVARTLIEQIEHLSQIASDFSAFANIAYANNEVLLLNHILASIVRLHHGYDHVEVLYDKPDTHFYVLADKTQLNRLFTNLVQNGMQSIPEDKEGRICVRAYREDGSVVVEVADNGEGIPEEVQPRIFTPNFTTKSSGTGLGLAMCKNIVEQSRGNIWFETEVGKGSVFFVRFPLVQEAGEEA